LLQVRAEFVILALAVVSVLVPEIEERLKEALPGRGRQRLADVVEGAVTGLLLQPSLRDTVKQELAWSSVSLIRNTNSCGVVVVDGGQVVLARGALGAGAVVADKAASLNNMSKVSSAQPCHAGSAQQGARFHPFQRLHPTMQPSYEACHPRTLSTATRSSSSNVCALSPRRTWQR
jgi:hypothetical protein